MIYYIAGLSLTRIPALAAYKRAWCVFVGYAKRIRETSFTSHFEIGLLIYGVVNHTIYNTFNLITFSFARRNISPIGECCEADSEINFGATSISSTCKWIYTQEYRSGHNEAVLKTVCLTGTGVRIPQPAPKNKDIPCGSPLFFATVRGDEPSFATRNGEFAYRRHIANHEAQSIRGICVARRCRLKLAPKRND